MVTGVLPLALEDATKTIQAFLLTGKEYVCLMALHADVEEKKIQAVLEEFVGDILQRPPVRAAVRRDVRKRRIYYIRDVELDGREVLFRVGCQAGTYIRKLVYCFVYSEGRASRLVQGAHVERSDDEGGSRTSCKNCESHNAS